jgi:hypothetical protein
MRLDDQLKLIKAGYRIFRKDEHTLRIKEAAGKGCGWRNFGKFNSKAELNRAYVELMKNEKHIEG